MGLLDGLIGAKSPNLNVVPLDSGTTKLIGDQYAHATQSDQALTNEQNQGVAQAGNQMLQTAEQGQQSNAQMGGGYSDAIRNQYNKVAGKSINDTLNTNAYNTSLHRAHLLQTAASSAMAQQRVETQNYEEQMKAMMQAEASRAQVLSSVLGLAGTAGGMWAAGGFKGMGGKGSPDNAKINQDQAGGPMDAGGAEGNVYA